MALVRAAQVGHYSTRLLWRCVIAPNTPRRRLEPVIGSESEPDQWGAEGTDSVPPTRNFAVWHGPRFTLPAHVCLLAPEFRPSLGNWRSTPRPALSGYRAATAGSGVPPYPAGSKSGRNPIRRRGAGRVSRNASAPARKYPSCAACSWLRRSRSSSRRTRSVGAVWADCPEG